MTDYKMEISIITPVYNAESYISRCIDSMLDQECIDTEIIIIDDGSTDNTEKIVNVYTKNYSNILFVPKKNEGVSIARNIGIELASKKYICFVDADDFLESDSLHKLVKIANDYNTDIVCGDYTEINGSKVVAYNNRYDNTEKMTGAEFLKMGLSMDEMPVGIWLGVYRTDFIRNYSLYFKKGSYYEDELWTPLAYIHAQSVIYSPTNFYGYYIHDKSTTHKSVFKKQGIDLIHISHDLKTASDKIDDENLKYLLEDKIATIYLDGVYIAQLYKNQFDYLFNDDFLSTLHVKKKNEFKIKLFKCSKHLYFYTNRAVKTASLLKHVFSKVKSIAVSIQYKVQYNTRLRLRELIINRPNKKRLINQDFSIICNTCNGAVMTSELGVRLNTPTVNLYFEAKDFLKFLQNLDYYLNCTLSKVENNFFSYPVGKLGDIRIYFMHYKSFEQAKDAWERRKKRINKDNIYIFMTDRNDCNDDIVKQFDNLPFKNKVIFTSKKHEDIDSAYLIKKYEGAKEVGILTDFVTWYGRREYDDVFDYVTWLNTGKINMVV